MNNHFYRLEKDEIAREILAYLSEHPGAQDTLEGIVQWWLLERKIKLQIDLVKDTISELVLKELIIEHSVNNSVVCYRINKDVWKAP